MITVEQIKAARALLDWNQQQLADAAGLSKPGIANLERRTAKPRMETVQSIQKTLENAGIEFTEGPGVRLRSDTLSVQVFRGEDSIYRLWNDIYDSLKTGEERLISGVDEKKFLSVTGERFDNMMQKYAKKGIKGRILSMKGDKNFPDPTSKYRWISKELFQNVPYYVYANKYAMLLWEPSPRVILIENQAVADNYRAIFNLHWKNAALPKK